MTCNKLGWRCTLSSIKTSNSKGIGCDNNTHNFSDESGTTLNLLINCMRSGNMSYPKLSWFFSNMAFKKWQSTTSISIYFASKLVLNGFVGVSLEIQYLKSTSQCYQTMGVCCLMYSFDCWISNEKLFFEENWPFRLINWLRKRY